MKNLYLIGTSHIARESIRQVTTTILATKPAVVAVELDARRLPALFTKQPSLRLSAIFKLGIRAYLFAKITAKIEHKLGRMVGIAPGSEMKAAIQLASQNRIKIALIDQDIEITLRKLSKRITFREKLRFVKDMLSALFFARRKIAFNPTKVPPKELIQKLTKEIKQRYPTIYAVLIQERDLHMAKVLKKILTDYPEEKVVAVVGAGHIDGITHYLKQKDGVA